MLALAARSRSRGKPVGVYIEDKDPAFHESAGLPLEKKLVEALVSAGYKEDAGVAVILQSFEEQVRPACDASAVPNHERTPLFLTAEKALGHGQTSRSAYVSRVQKHEAHLLPARCMWSAHTQ